MNLRINFIRIYKINKIMSSPKPIFGKTPENLQKVEDLIMFLESFIF